MGQKWGTGTQIGSLTVTDWWKWVNTHKNQTIQLVGPVLKQYALVATRASEARFPGPKSSL